MRKFTDEGTENFKTLVLEIANLRINEISPEIVLKLEALVNDDRITIGLRGKLENLTNYTKRFELAEYFFNLFKENSDLYLCRTESGFWNWISARYLLDLLQSLESASINTRIGGVERWVLTRNTLRYHRHLVSGPFFAYEANFPNPRNAMCQLATNVLDPGELVERISGKRDLASGNVCLLATLLYYDNIKNSLRAGHTSPFGNPKAFSRFFSQLDRTVDYESLSVKDLLELLPENFHKWKKFAQAAIAEHG